MRAKEKAEEEAIMSRVRKGQGPSVFREMCEAMEEFNKQQKAAEKATPLDPRLLRELEGIKGER
jgi:hypothetical protein